MTVRPLRTDSIETWLAERSAGGAIVIYKHSPLCAASLFAAEEIRYFAWDFPGVPAYEINVITQRALSRALAAALGVPHASPQALWVEGGRAIWHASHGAITYDRLRELAER